MSDLFAQIGEAAAVVQSRCALRPEVAIILGTGLGGLAREVAEAVAVPYADIPHMPTTTLEAHAGRLILGRLSGRPVVVMQGRFHLYEGYTASQITFGVRVMRRLGAKTLVVSNACGGMDPQWRAGDLLLIEDHINLLGVNPLIGPNDERLGPRYPDMCWPYDRSLLALAEAEALALGIRAHRGVYVAVPGPNLETRAEYRFLRAIGADAVGMSTVPEVIAAVHGGMRVVGIAIVTDMCLPDALEPGDISKIIATANEAEPRLTRLVRAVIEKME
jgi:purine-nucleoside phosphorylase